MTAKIERTLDLDAPIDRVWQALTDERELACWFPNDGAELAPTAGAEGWFTWDLPDDDCEGGRYAVRVEEAQPPHRLVWSWAREPETAVDAGQNTRVEWTLTATESGGTRLNMCESGFVDPVHREGNEAGWTSELGELVAYLEAAA